MKFESVVLGQESQGQPAAVEERRGGTRIVCVRVLFRVNVQKSSLLLSEIHQCDCRRATCEKPF